MKAIETEYNGYLFRSRLEARWAVFFDALDIDYEYEKEGFELESGEWYLPDFWLPEPEVWVEIKPDEPRLDQAGVREYELCESLAKESGNIVWLIGGRLGYTEDAPIADVVDFSYSIAMFSPDMLVSHEDSSPTGIAPSFWVSDPRHACRIEEFNFVSSYKLYGFLYRKYGQEEDFPQRGEAHKLIEWDRKYFRDAYGEEHPSWHYGIADYAFVFQDVKSYSNRHITLGARLAFECSQRVRNALDEGQQARFEYGQVGGPSSWKE